METRASYFLVGLFVLGLIAGSFAFVAWLTRFELKDERLPYHVYFRGSVTGLSIGSPVRYRGVPVGTVSGIAIDPKNVERVEVTLAINPGTPIKTDTVAGLQLQGITGYSFVQLTGGTQEAPLLTPQPGQRYAVIPSQPSALERVFEDAPELVARLGLLATRAAEILSPDNEKRLTAILANAETFTAALAQSAGSIESTAEDASKALAEIRAAASSFGQVSRDLQGLGASVSRAAGGAEGAVADIRTAAQSFQRVADQLDKFVQENRRPMRDFTGSGLYDLSQLIAESRTLVATLTRVAYQLERDPARFLFGDQQRGYQPR